MICDVCESEVRLVHRFEDFRYYRCACPIEGTCRNGASWCFYTLTREGLEFVLGNSGSFVLRCSECNNTTLEDRVTSYCCVFCGGARVTPVLLGVANEKC